VSSTQEVLGVAKQAKENAARNQGQKKPRTTAVDVMVSGDEEKVLEIMHTGLECNCIILANSKAM
jgi:hypothetical protein